jgi:N-acetylmuramoyl-L-alanine amidase
MTPDPLRRASLAAAGVLAACALAACSGVPVDTTYTAKGQDSRVMFLVIHYTAEDFPRSLRILTEQAVSSHYLLSDESPPKVYRLVDENRRAWHSGASAWGVNHRLNASSVGIEIVHPGFVLGPRDGQDRQRIYQPFPQAQMDVLIPLVKDIVARHQILPERVLGHGEVSPSYKEDPGPTFPWKQLADAGITPPWPDAARVAAEQVRFEQQLPDAAWFQERLAKHGYNIVRTGSWDGQSQRVLMNFQMRYRPGDYKGQMDAESAALLQVLATPLSKP